MGDAVNTNEQAPAPVAGYEISRPASDQPVEAIDAGREEILPCPFCGTAAVVNRSERAVTVGCDFNDCPSRECFAAGRVAEEAGVISAWNTRAALSPAPPARTPMGGEVEALREALEATVAIRWEMVGTPTDSEAATAWALALDEIAVVAAQALAAASPSPAQGRITVDALAQEIRRVDGNHSLGAGALAEALMPFLSASPQPEAGEADWNRDLTAAPEGEAVLLATTAGHVGEAIAPVRDDPDDDWFWAGAGFVHANHKPVAWKRLPAHPFAPPSVQPVEVK